MGRHGCSEADIAAIVTVFDLVGLDLTNPSTIP